MVLQLALIHVVPSVNQETLPVCIITEAAIWDRSEGAG